MTREHTTGFLVQIGARGTPVLVPAGRGPFQDADGWSGGGEWVRRGPLEIVGDVRLDNRGDLQAALGVEPGDDLSLVLSAFARWGSDVVDHLDGPFSFVVWDGETRTAFAARDPLGRRPLFLARTEAGMVLGSSLAQVHRHATPDLDPQGVADYLRGDLRPLRRTLRRDVQRVPAAHAVTIRDGEVAERRYWSPVATPDGPPGDAPEAFREAFDRAVSRRLGDRIGAFLSGGLDSSSIVATARALRPELPLTTFSIVYREQREADERRYVEAVADHVGVDPVLVDGDTLSLLDGLDSDLEAYGEPLVTPNVFLARTLYAASAARGLRGVLDGFGGDNVVGHGDRRLTELAFGLRWPTLWREARSAARRTTRPRGAMLDFARDYVWGPVRDRIAPPEPPISFEHPDLAAEAPRWPPRPWSDRAALVEDLSSPTIPRALEVTYALAQPYGVEPLFPFIDRRLVELSLALPSDERLRDGLTRSVLRRAMDDRLPESLLSRAGKARLAVSFSFALFDRDADRLRRHIEEDLHAAEGLVDVGAVRAAWTRASHDSAARADVALPLWRAVVLARWLAIRRSVSESSIDRPASNPRPSPTLR